jgi:cytoplasmic iron level regulating protein YaaA (DUF328/UPF0246 family)
MIIAPAMKMQVDGDSLPPRSQPQFLEQAQTLHTWLKTLSFEQAQQLWQCSVRLARLNYDQLQRITLKDAVTPAVLAYIGLQYQSLAPGVLSQAALDYLQDHLRIMSGFYGVLRPFDAVIPYRLEMQSKPVLASKQNLYQIWGPRLYQALHFEQGPVLNLASMEYAKAVLPYLKPTDQFVTCRFGKLQNGQVKQQATAAKMARGTMVRYLAERQINTVAEVKMFDQLNYQYLPDLSTPTELVFGC